VTRSDLANIIVMTSMVALLVFVWLARPRVSAWTNNIVLITLGSITAAAALLSGEPFTMVSGVVLTPVVVWAAYTEHKRAAREGGRK